MGFPAMGLDIDLAKPPQMVVKRKGNGTPKLSGKSRLVKYYNLARKIQVPCFVLLVGCLPYDIGGASTVARDDAF